MAKVRTPLEEARRAFNNWRLTDEGKMFRATLFAKNKGKCPLCRCHMILRFDGIVTPNTATLDHKIPLQEALGTDLKNLDLICQRCNSMKANRPVSGTVEEGEWREIKRIFIK